MPVAESTRGTARRRVGRARDRSGRERDRRWRCHRRGRGGSSESSRRDRRRARRRTTSPRAVGPDRVRATAAGPSARRAGRRHRAGGVRSGERGSRCRSVRRRPTPVGPGCTAPPSPAGAGTAHGVPVVPRRSASSSKRIRPWSSRNGPPSITDNDPTCCGSWGVSIRRNTVWAAVSRSYPMLSATPQCLARRGWCDQGPSAQPRQAVARR